MGFFHSIYERKLFLLLSATIKSKLAKIHQIIPFYSTSNVLCCSVCSCCICEWMWSSHRCNVIIFTHWTLKLTLYRNQSIDLQSKSIDRFLYDDNFGVQWIKWNACNFFPLENILICSFLQMFHFWVFDKFA